MTPAFPSRLPRVGTTIFTTMSALANQHGAINLGQGFPDFPCDPRIIDAVSQAMRDGHNQYPPMTGVPALREAIACKIQAATGRAYNPGSEITVTSGATQAILTAILCCVHPGDEVIVIEPVYDSYIPGIELAGGVPVVVPMTTLPDRQGHRIDWSRVAAAVTSRTRLIMVNSPHNPTGSIVGDDDLNALADIVRGTDVLLLSDEVYEHMVYDGRVHASMSRHAELAERAFVVSSFGKTFHVTGWKIGYCAAPAPLSAEFRKVHQFNVFTTNTPMQHGIAHYLADPTPYHQLAGFYQRKRDRFREGLSRTRLHVLPCAGSYFQLVDYSALDAQTAALDEESFCRWLTTEIGVAAIPVSAFYDAPRAAGSNQKLARFCFAKRDETLDQAIERLMSI
jgi:methionine aminotransferase